MRKIILTVNLLLVVIIASAQIAYWPFNGDAIDYSGYGNDGIIEGATFADDVNGIPGNALSFIDNSRVEISNIEPFYFDRMMTVSFWMKSQSTENERWFSTVYCQTDDSWYINMNDGKFGFTAFIMGSTKIKKLYTLQQYNDNQWHHVVFVYNANELKLDFYKDGILDVSYNLPFPGTIEQGGSYFSISGGPCGIRDGFLDEVKIFPHPLSDVEVQQIYSEGVPIVPTTAGEISGNNNVCPGDVNVEYSVPPIAGATGYVWELPEGATISSGANTESIKVDFSSSAVSGNISVYGTNNEYFGESSNLNINVGKPGSAGAINGSNFVAPDDIVAYSISEVDGATGYEWELPGATIISGANTNSIEVTFSSSSGLIKVTPINNCGEGEFSSLMVNVGDIITSVPITINPSLADKNYLLFKTNETNLGIIGSDTKLYSGGNSDNLGMYVYGDNNLEFSTNNTKRLVINGTGYVGIGTSSPVGDLDIASVNTPQVYIQSLATSSQDAILNIRGSRTTSTTSDIAQIKFGSNDVTGGDLASITVRKHTASTNEGDLLFWTTSSNGNMLTEKMRITKDGNIGIGTTNPLTKVHIADANLPTLRLSGTDINQSNSGTIEFAEDDVANNEARFAISYDGSTNKLHIKSGSVSPSIERLTILRDNGNVGIGITAPIYKLAVKGTIGCGEVIVTDVSIWSDFVFEPSYNLMSLKDLETFIQENKHLPEIPTTAEVQENGISVGEMNAKLLQKIEELTLYVIELQKEVEILKEKNK